MMLPPGFNLPTGTAKPFQMIPPEVLAQLAATSFRPPQPSGPPGMMGNEPTPGFNVGDGMAGLGMGLAGLKKGGNPFMAAERTAGDRDLAGYGMSPVDPMSGNPNAQPVEVFDPSGRGGGVFSWLRGLF